MTSSASTPQETSLSNRYLPTSKFHVVTEIAASGTCYLRPSLIWLGIQIWFHPYLSPTAGGGVPFDPDKDVPDLEGKVILVTGGNTGIGKETILELAKHNPAKIYMAARSQSKAAEAIHSIRSTLLQSTSSNPNPQLPEIIHIPLDLSSPTSISSCATTFLSQSSRLDILILNAGIMAMPNATLTTPLENVDPHIAVNHVGHFDLFTQLLPALLSTPDARVVTLSSEAGNLAPLSPPDQLLEKQGPPTPFEAYSWSKALNIYFASEVARRWPQLTSVSVYPGLIKTDLYDNLGARNILVRWTLAFTRGLGMFQGPRDGAKAVVWTAVVEKGRLENGGYYTPGGRLWKGHPRTEDQGMGRRVWKWSQKLVEEWNKKGQ